jgi:hypothetical protein
MSRIPVKISFPYICPNCGERLDHVFLSGTASYHGCTICGCIWNADTGIIVDYDGNRIDVWEQYSGRKRKTHEESKREKEQEAEEHRQREKKDRETELLMEHLLLISQNRQRQGKCFICEKNLSGYDKLCFRGYHNGCKKALIGKTGTAQTEITKGWHGGIASIDGKLYEIKKDGIRIFDVGTFRIEFEDEAFGLAKVCGELWLCRSASGERIVEGSSIEVVNVDGFCGGVFVQRYPGNL